MVGNERDRGKKGKEEGNVGQEKRKRKIEGTR